MEQSNYYQSINYCLGLKTTLQYNNIATDYSRLWLGSDFAFAST